MKVGREAAIALGAFLLGASGKAPRLLAGENPHLTVRLARGPITVDGSLEDPGWRGAAEIRDFYEISPGDNTPSKVGTTAWVTYDDRFFYVAIKCDDPRPKDIQAQYVERDHVNSDQDFAGIMLDTRDDGRTGIEFFVNPYGIQDDFVRDESVVNGSSEDASPDFHWDSAARITAQGWQLEMRIPFSSLRYGRTDPQTWGIVVFRSLTRDFRYQIASNRAPRESSCFICHALKLEGLAGLPRGSHVVVAPYGTLTESGVPLEGPGSPFRNEPVRGNGGLDLKWVPDENFALDGTLNPDFSQIESDVAQISANNRFALFYAEKRPFFMERSQLFNSPVQAIYTRTITSPRWGARASGDSGGTAWTVLAAEDRGGGAVIIPGPARSSLAPQDLSSFVAIGRAEHNLSGRSFAGVLVTDREVEGGGHNRVFGPDFLWAPNDQDQIAGQFLLSATQTPDRPDLSPDWDGRSFSSRALTAQWTHSSTHWNWNAVYRDLGEGFRADVGFVPQVGIREFSANPNYVFYTTGLFSRVIPVVFGDYVAGTSGGTVTSNLAQGIAFQGKAGLNGEIDYYSHDLERAGPNLLPARHWALNVYVGPGGFLSSVSLQAHLGDAIDYIGDRAGRGGDATTSIRLRPTRHLQLQFDGAFQWLNLSGERLFTSRVERLKATYVFDPRVFLRAIGQYVRTDYAPSRYPVPVPATAGGFQGSALLGYQLDWQSVLYLGYGDNRALSEDARLLKAGRDFFLKISYAFQR
jgi:uncharacterized protein DUF5916/cellulose/xylan binding protein with CBM9 domain